MAVLPSAFDARPRSGALIQKSNSSDKLIINPGFQCDDRHTWAIFRQQIVGKCDDRHCLTCIKAPNSENQKPLPVMAQGRLAGQMPLLNKPIRRDRLRKSVQDLLDRGLSPALRTLVCFGDVGSGREGHLRVVNFYGDRLSRSRWRSPMDGKPLSSDKNAILAEQQLVQEADQRWSLGRSALFITAASILLWAIIGFGVRELI